MAVIKNDARKNGYINKGSLVANDSSFVSTHYKNGVDPGSLNEILDLLIKQDDASKIKIVDPNSDIQEVSGKVYKGYGSFYTDITIDTAVDITSLYALDSDINIYATSFDLAGDATADLSVGDILRLTEGATHSLGDIQSISYSSGTNLTTISIGTIGYNYTVSGISITKLTMVSRDNPIVVDLLYSSDNYNPYLGTNPYTATLIPYVILNGNNNYMGIQALSSTTTSKNHNLFVTNTRVTNLAYQSMGVHVYFNNCFAEMLNYNTGENRPLTMGGNGHQKFYTYWYNSSIFGGEFNNSTVTEGEAVFNNCSIHGGIFRTCHIYNSTIEPKSYIDITNNGTPIEHNPVSLQFETSFYIFNSTVRGYDNEDQSHGFSITGNSNHYQFYNCYCIFIDNTLTTGNSNNLTFNGCQITSLKTNSSSGRVFEGISTATVINTTVDRFGVFTADILDGLVDRTVISTSSNIGMILNPTNFSHTSSWDIVSAMKDLDSAIRSTSEIECRTVFKRLSTSTIDISGNTPTVVPELSLDLSSDFSECNLTNSYIAIIKIEILLFDWDNHFNIYRSEHELKVKHETGGQPYISAADTINTYIQHFNRRTTPPYNDTMEITFETSTGDTRLLFTINPNDSSGFGVDMVMKVKYSVLSF